MRLSLDPAARHPLMVRSSVLRSLRATLDSTGFQEVETPMLLRSQGGANARPFTTELNATHDRLSLRIAPELALKRLVAGGFPQVYELAKDFRNEGLDRTHSPEFTVLEAYAAFGDVNSMHLLAERLLRDAAIAVTGGPRLRLTDGTQIDLSAPWPVRDQFDALSEVLGDKVTSTTPRDRWVQLCLQHDLPAPADDDVDRLTDRLYGKLVEARTQRPTFYTGFSSASTPLAAALPGAPDRASRWDLVAGGMEIGTGYTELTDAVEQRKRLLEQSWYAEHGDPEAMHYDQAFIQALEYGVPPLGGLGLGVDRIIMLLAGVDIHATLAESLWERNPR
jgi:lysyl-tRNA synthetase class 2